MAEQRDKKNSGATSKTKSGETSVSKGTARTAHSNIELDENATLNAFDINLGGKRMGGPTGGDLAGGGKGPAIGEKHAADDSSADHYGSREETNAALEDKIALQNTIRLHEHF